MMMRRRRMKRRRRRRRKSAQRTKISSGKTWYLAFLWNGSEVSKDLEG